MEKRQKWEPPRLTEISTVETMETVLVTQSEDPWGATTTNQNNSLPPNNSGT